MAGLQRSSETFRRSGSSGMVWEDKYRSASTGKLIAKPAAQTKKDATPPTAARQQRSSSSGSRHGGYRTGHVPPALDPPSPRVAACGFCSLFGKDNKQPVQGGAGGRANATGRRR